MQNTAGLAMLAVFCERTKLQYPALYDVDMTQHTARDEVWNLALDRAQAGDSVSPAFLAENTNASERTARDVLKTMVDYGWLEENESHWRQNDFSSGMNLEA